MEKNLEQALYNKILTKKTYKIQKKIVGKNFKEKILKQKFKKQCLRFDKKCWLIILKKFRKKMEKNFGMTF